MTQLNDGVIALVSIGMHPASGRARRAMQDARAVELGLRLAGPGLGLLHAGDPSQDVLRDYLGMGVRRLQVMSMPPDADALPALVEHLASTGVQLLLTGTRAETGEGSGMLPFLLAERLGWPLLSGLVEVERIEAGVAQVLQALPRGQRRRLRVRLPFVASVDDAAPAPRQSAFGPARRGHIELIGSTATIDAVLAQHPLRSARPRPKRLKLVKASNAAERMKLATAKARGGGGQVLTGLTPQAGAEAILKLLSDEGLLR